MNKLKFNLEYSILKVTEEENVNKIWVSGRLRLDVQIDVGPYLFYTQKSSRKKLVTICSTYLTYYKHKLWKGGVILIARN